MEFDMNKQHRTMVSVDREQYLREMSRYKAKHHTYFQRLSLELGKGKNYLVNVNKTGRISIEILEKLEAKGINIKIIAPCSVQEIKNFFDEIDSKIDKYKLNTEAVALGAFEYYENKNWHCKNGIIISRANVRYVLSRWYERDLQANFGIDYKVILPPIKNPVKKIKKKQEQKKKEPEVKPTQIPLNLVYEADEDKQLQETRREIEEIRKRINEDIMALDRKLFELQHNQRTSYIKSLKEIVKKIDENKYFF